MNIFLVSKHREEPIVLATTNREKAEQALVDLGPGGFHIHEAELHGMIAMTAYNETMAAFDAAIAAEPPIDKRTEELLQAMGLLSTIHPSMEIDVNHPLKMAHEIVAYVERMELPIPKPVPLESQPKGEPHPWQKANPRRNR